MHNHRSSWIIVGLLLAGLCASATPIPAAPAPPAARDGWPDTPAGAAARRWVEAYGKGEASMRECLAEILAPESLAARGLDARMETYRESRERFGSLVLASIDKSTPGEVEATLLAADLSKHRFVFKAQTVPPHKLLSIGRVEHGHAGHGGFRH